jgi:hypothetical protein
MWNAIILNSNIYAKKKDVHYFWIKLDGIKYMGVDQKWCLNSFYIQTIKPF